MKERKAEYRNDSRNYKIISQSELRKKNEDSRIFNEWINLNVYIHTHTRIVMNRYNLGGPNEMEIKLEIPLCQNRSKKFFFSDDDDEWQTLNYL